MVTKTREIKLDRQAVFSIAQAVAEILTDPDSGLELRPHVRKRLKRMRAQKGKIIPLAQIKKEFRL